MSAMRRPASSAAFAALCSRDAASLTAAPAASASACFELMVDLQNSSPRVLHHHVPTSNESHTCPTC